MKIQRIVSSLLNSNMYVVSEQGHAILIDPCITDYVNAIISGMIDTNMYRRYLADSGGTEAQANQALLRRQYLGIGKTEDIASAAAFLLSPAAQFITGTCIPVDGGYSAS